MIGLALPFSFEEPQWLWLVLLVPVLVLVSLRSLAGLDPVRRVLAVTVRSLVIIAIAVTLARIVKVIQNDDITVLFLMDRSNSVDKKQAEVEQYIYDVSKKAKPDDRVGLIDFAGGAYLEQLPMRGGYSDQLLGRLPSMPNPDRTDIASAIRLAMAMFPADTAKRIVLASDGNDNMGDVLTEAQRARADGVVIDVVPLWYTYENEIYFDRLMAPTYAEKGEQVPIRMLIHSSRRARGRIYLEHNGREVPLPEDYARVELQPGNNPFILKLPINTTGPQRFSAEFYPDAEYMDEMTANNRATAFSIVPGKRKALILSMEPKHDEPLLEALHKENVLAEIRDVTESEIDLLEMMSYSAIILANVPASMFTDADQQMLATYVKDLGGGLIMTGGEEGFGAGGWIGTPVEEVLPVTCEIKHKKVIPRGALVLIMHSCEIPRGNVMGKLVAKKSVDTISSRDYIGVLAYSWSPMGVNWEVPLQLAFNKNRIKSRIDTMQIGDMPDFQSTMNMALKGLQATDAAQKHVIIISDGDPSPPTKTTLDGFVKSKITISTIGIGYGSHCMDQSLRRIAKETGGRFYACRNPRTLPQIFVKESKVIRKPLIIDEPFPPTIRFAFSDLLTGIHPDEHIPDLGGLVLTSLKPMAQMPLVRASKDGDDPVLAHWQYKLGKAVAFTSGNWPRWGRQWTRWPKFAKLWAQIVRWSMRQESPANFETFTRIEGNRGRVVLEALDKNADYLNFLQLPSVVINPDQTTTSLVFSQTGPGRYEATFDISQTGQYIANVGITQQGQAQGSIYAGVSLPFSPEYRELSTNEGLLRQIQETTGGRWLTMDAESDEVFSRDLPPTVSKRSLWDWAVAWLLLPLFLLDVAARRLASWLAFSICVEVVLLAFLLFGLEIVYDSWWGVLGSILLAEMVGWSIRFRSIGPLFNFITHSVTALGQVGERSQVSLEQLKSTRQRVQDTQTTAGGKDVPGERIAPAAEPAHRPDAKARFDVGDKAAAAPASDLQDQLGGAKTEPGFQEKRRRPAKAGGKGDQADQEETTSRLLRAKRRAQEQQEDGKNGK
ncbi:MAG: VWA domain-containing protein [Phycisphaerae bacterium]|nr:VWA domain-containing protein [Phycisphaerae bacterium]